MNIQRLLIISVFVLSSACGGGTQKVPGTQDPSLGGASVDAGGLDGGSTVGGSGGTGSGAGGTQGSGGGTQAGGTGTAGGADGGAGATAPGTDGGGSLARLATWDGDAPVVQLERNSANAAACAGVLPAFVGGSFPAHGAFGQVSYVSEPLQTLDGEGNLALAGDGVFSSTGARLGSAAIVDAAPLPRGFINAQFGSAGWSITRLSLDGAALWSVPGFTFAGATGQNGDVVTLGRDPSTGSVLVDRYDKNGARLHARVTLGANVVADAYRAGIDAQGNALVLWGTAGNGGGRWLSRDGASLGDVTPSAPVADFPCEFAPLLGSGLACFAGGNWLAIYLPGAGVQQPPAWLSSTARLTALPSRNGYALADRASPGGGSLPAACVQQIALVNADGLACGSVKFTGAAQDCIASELVVGSDGTVARESLTQLCTPDGCTSARRLWPQLLGAGNQGGEPSPSTAPRTVLSFDEGAPAIAVDRTAASCAALVPDVSSGTLLQDAASPWCNAAPKDRTRLDFPGGAALKLSFRYTDVVPYAQGGGRSFTAVASATSVDAAGKPTGPSQTLFSSYEYVCDSCEGPVFSVAGAVDAQGNALALFSRDGALQARWVNKDGTPASDAFAAGKDPGEQAHNATWVVSPTAQGAALRVGGLWTSTFAPSALKPSPAPQWMASRPQTDFTLVRGGRAYAFTPVPGQVMKTCSQRLELVAADTGETCGGVTFKAGDAACTTRALHIGADGTVARDAQVEQCNGTACTCSTRSYARLLE